MTINRADVHVAEGDLHAQLAALKSDLSAVKGDLSSITAALMKQGAASAHAAKDDVERRLHEGVEQSREYVKNRPLTAALAAFGIGALAGFLLHRR